MKLLVADDHPLVRDALARTLRRIEPDADVHEAGDFATVQRICETLDPVLALLDLNMPGMNGVEGLRTLRRRFPHLFVIVASGQQDPPTIRCVLAAGANGFFPKSSESDLLLQAVRLVLAGGSYVPMDALADVDTATRVDTTSAVELTPRQLDVLQRLLRGLPNKTIARELNLTEGTVKIHIAAILRALRARNRTEAVVRARELGLDGLAG
jgi:DNA-binding NarL/FixJ family response regulator